MTIKCSCSAGYECDYCAGYNNGLDDAGVEAATVAAIVTWLSAESARLAAIDTRETQADAQTLDYVAGCIRSGDWRKAGGR